MIHSVCRLAGTAALGSVLLLGAQAAQAITYEGSILTGAAAFSLVHGGSGVTPTDDPDDWLRFDAGQSFTFDVTGLVVTASGPQSYSLTSNNGATATFVIESMSLELDDTTGIPSGTLAYSLDGVAGVFSFAEETYDGTVFNSSVFDGDTLSVFLWGGDTVNDIGIDWGFTGSPIPVPPAVLLFGSAIAGLGLMRRRRRDA